MKQLCWVMLALLCPVAFADEVGVADCNAKDSDLRVEIYRLDRVTTARVYENDTGDPIEFSKVIKAKSHLFTADDFRLQVTVDKKHGSKDEDPRYPSHLSAKAADGHKIEADLLCAVY